MASVSVFPERKEGRILPVHGVGQPPFLGMDFSMFSTLTDARIPFSRLHDVGGAFGGGRYVDVPNVFPNFDADPEDPASYDFVFTDRLICALVAAGVEPYYRLGVTIENYAALRAYRIDPPRDFLKWAKICEGIIRHYTEGWAEGYHFTVRYWEIWNEPENGMAGVKPNMMWTGTMEEYFELYRVSVSYLKGRFPHLKFGGYAASGVYNVLPVKPRDEHPYTGTLAEYRISIFKEFLKYLKKHGCPLDFFSWHSYEDRPAYNALYARFVRETLDEYGYKETESHLNEWNGETSARGTVHHAALCAANLCVLQKEKVDAAMFYDARFGVSVYGALYHPLTRKPFPAYYPFLAFGELYRRGTAVRVQTEGEGVFAVAAEGEGKTEVLAVNLGEDGPFRFSAEGRAASLCRILTEEGWRECPLPETLPKDGVLWITV